MTYENDKHQSTDVFQEDSFLKSAIDSTKKAAGAVLGTDIDDANKAIKDAEGARGKIKAVNDEYLGKAADSLSAVDKALKGHKVDTRSIVARARNSVLQFPIYVTQTLRVNEAQIIAKMFERVYTTLVQTVLSHNQILNEEEANNLVFLKNFHTNLKEAADVFVNTYYKPIDEIDQIMQESVYFSQQLTEGCSVDFSVVPCIDPDLIAENARLLNEPLTGFIYLREDTKDTTNEASTKLVPLSDSEEKKLLDDLKDKGNCDDADVKRAANMTDSEYQQFVTDANTSEKEYKELETDAKLSMSDSEYKKLPDAEKKKVDEAREKKQRIDDAKQNQPTIGKVRDAIPDGFKLKGGSWYRTDRTNKTVNKTTTSLDPQKALDAPKMLRDADIKKINGMLPWTFEAHFRLRTKNGIDREIRYVIGVKSVMHLIRTQDLSEDLHELVTGNIKSLQKVRYKTGEINFKDYYFNIKGLKADAAKHINYNKRWINTLKRLAEYEKTHGTFLNKPIRAITGGSAPIPNGTLILAQPDVTILTNQTGIDLSKVPNAKRLAKSLFLIGVVIVDSSAGTMRVLFPDSDNDWDVQSLAAIDAELAKTDNSQLMKELNRMVNR